MVVVVDLPGFVYMRMCECADAALVCGCAAACTSRGRYVNVQLLVQVEDGDSGTC